MSSNVKKDKINNQFYDNKNNVTIVSFFFFFRLLYLPQVQLLKHDPRLVQLIIYNVWYMESKCLENVWVHQ